MENQWIIKDEKFVGLINKLSDSLYNYSFSTMKNINLFINIFNSKDAEISLKKEIKNFMFLSKTNLNIFYSEVKQIFKNLVAIRKMYLKNITNLFDNIKLENEKLKQINNIKRNKSANLNRNNYNSCYIPNGLQNMPNSYFSEKINLSNQQKSSSNFFINKNSLLSDNNNNFSLINNGAINNKETILIKEINSLKKNKSILNNKIEGLLNYNKNMELQHNKKLKSLISKIKKKNNIINVYRLKLNEKEALIKNIKRNHSINKTQIQRDKKIFKKMKNEKEYLSINLEMKENELNSLRTYNNRLLNENNQLNKMMKESVNNFDKLNFQESQIDKLQNLLNEKETLIKNLKNNCINIQFEKKIKELKNKNKKLFQENYNLKQNLFESTSQQTMKTNSLNEYIKKLEEKIMEEKKKSQSVNSIFEEEKNKIKSENEILKLKIRDSENENKLMKIQNDELKKEIENKRDKVKYLTISNSNYEEEYNLHDLAKSALEQNNSEDMRIDFPGLNDVNKKYAELKEGVKELKELFEYIISHTQTDDQDIKEKSKRACEILKINLE